VPTPGASYKKLTSRLPSTFHENPFGANSYAENSYAEKSLDEVR
jgi:hypothetical protein